MDDKDFVNNVVYQPEKIRREFYWEKAKALLGRQGNDSILAKMDVKNKDVIDTIKKYFPEATIYSDYLIKMKNVDFKICNSGQRKYIATKGFGWFYVRNIPNLVEFMKETDRLMPEWEKEFANMIAAYGNDIMDKQRNWVLKGKRTVDNILEYRIELSLLECRPTPNSTTNMSFENFHIKIQYGQILIVVPNHCTVDFYNNGIDIEHFRQLDKLIPIWIDELAELNLEYKKLEKSKEVGELSVTALVKKKMKALGCEYYIKRNFKSMSLYIKVDQQCMTKLFLPYNDIGLIRRRLDSIDDTLNGKRMYNVYRMNYKEERMNWQCETPEEKEDKI